MKILIIHEIVWLKKVPFKPHHFAELFSIIDAINFYNINIFKKQEFLTLIDSKDNNDTIQG